MVTMPSDSERGRPAKAASDVSTGIATSPSVPAAGETAQAKRLTERIRLRLVTIGENLEAVGPMVEQAKRSDTYLLLGYKSWTAYVAAEFGEHLSRLAKLDRGPVLELLSRAGMSARGIEAATKIPKSTVSREVSHRGTPADRVGREPRLRPDEIDGLISSGMVENLDDLERFMKMADANDQEFEQALTDARRDDDLSGENVAKKIIAKKTIGTDGKTYTRSIPAAPRRQNRRPLPDAYRDTSYTLLKNVGSLSRLHQDDRFPVNRDTVKGRSASDLAHAANELLDLLDELGVDRHQYGGGLR